MRSLAARFWRLTVGTRPPSLSAVLVPAIAQLLGDPPLVARSRPRAACSGCRCRCGSLAQVVSHPPEQTAESGLLVDAEADQHLLIDGFHRTATSSHVERPSSVSQTRMTLASAEFGVLVGVDGGL